MMGDSVGAHPSTKSDGSAARRETKMKIGTKIRLALTALALTLTLALPAMAASKAPASTPAHAKAAAPTPAPPALRDSKAHLEHAAHDFGGHRVEAIKAIDEAIRQLEICLKYDKD